jgi:hypothetical protein
MFEVQRPDLVPGVTKRRICDSDTYLDLGLLERGGGIGVEVPELRGGRRPK